MQTNYQNQDFDASTLKVKELATILESAGFDVPRGSQKKQLVSLFQDKIQNFDQENNLLISQVRVKDIGSNFIRDDNRPIFPVVFGQPQFAPSAEPVSGIFI